MLSRLVALLVRPQLGKEATEANAEGCDRVDPWILVLRYPSRDTLPNVLHRPDRAKFTLAQSVQTE